MQSLEERFRSGSPPYRLEPTGEGGFTLIRDEERADEFSRLVADLLALPAHDFIVIPTSDGNLGYRRAIILPLFDKLHVRTTPFP